MKFIRKIEKNMSKNTAGVIFVSAVFAVSVGRLCEYIRKPSEYSAFFPLKSKQLHLCAGADSFLSVFRISMKVKDSLNCCCSYISRAKAWHNWKMDDILFPWTDGDNEESPDICRNCTRKKNENITVKLKW